MGRSHFRARGAFIMKRMSYKRMMKSSCRVEPCSTGCEMNLPMNGAFFE
ncbi:hypothetical protein LINGRAHAP2_LOCUS20417 [Linum grandiflorum]